MSQWEPVCVVLATDDQVDVQVREGTNLQQLLAAVLSFCIRRGADLPRAMSEAQSMEHEAVRVVPEPLVIQ